MLLVQASAVELALSVSVLTCSLPNMIREYSDFVSVGYCTICSFLIGLLRPVAVWTVCGLNCDRYYAISAPLHYGSYINSKKVWNLKCLYITFNQIDKWKGKRELKIKKWKAEKVETRRGSRKKNGRRSVNVHNLYSLHLSEFPIW